MSTLLSISNLSKSFKKNKVLDMISLKIKAKSISAVVGESGSGKTTLMRIIAGLETPDQGSVIMKDHDLLKLPAEKRNVGLVFQDYALFPHLNVLQNISFGMHKEQNQTEQNQRLKSLLSLVDLDSFEQRYPHQLSGGQQQRVAIARALAPAPELLLLDEPFSNLDPIRRRDLRSQIHNLVMESNTSAMIVTHDMEDALKLADQIIILRQGSIVQKDNPQSIIDRPASSYVSDLLS